MVGYFFFFFALHCNFKGSVWALISLSVNENVCKWTIWCSFVQDIGRHNNLKFTFLFALALQFIENTQMESAELCIYQF